MRRIILALLVVPLVACSARHSPFFRDYKEWIPEASATAGGAPTVLIDWSTLPDVITSIDGTPLQKGYRKARVAPGGHQLEYADHPAEFGALPRGRVDLDLLAGHEYEFRIDYCFWCAPRKYAVWVDDLTTGELAWGKRPDWPSWWL